MSSIIDSLKKTALLSAIEPDGSAVLRYLHRWFSKTFHTPLSEVEDLPLEYILTHYFEDQYSELSSEEKHDLILFLLETPEEREERIRVENEEEERFFAEAQAEADGTLLKKNKALSKPLLDKAIRNIEALEKAIGKEEIKISFVEEIEDKASF